ncbi:hypothetical protein CONLIGDRAFT_161308 [Coniochaeta ligniaria NRRL 30616]|uniref:Uncharacterized protein n=1 Tax=Coniochaeta ligniaria NRRL 30616 TaxID=1408157 RepID=A0A1J7JSQ6_9PEZI|nr:hypothetical protein CONLIGDRAFT_161308 [Coniochaeta ligniaria NRRL 30616]
MSSRDTDTCSVSLRRTRRGNATKLPPVHKSFVSDWTAHDFSFSSPWQRLRARRGVHCLHCPHCPHCPGSWPKPPAEPSIPQNETVVWLRDALARFPGFRNVGSWFGRLAINVTFSCKEGKYWMRYQQRVEDLKYLSNAIHLRRRGLYTVQRSFDISSHATRLLHPQSSGPMAKAFGFEPAQIAGFDNNRYPVR